MKTHKKTKDFVILHFSIPDPTNRLSGPVWDPKIVQNRPRNASRDAQVAPRWRPNRPLDPQDGRPDEPRALQTAFQTVKDPILEVRGPSKPRFWPPGTHFASNLEVPSVILDVQRPILQPRSTHLPTQTSFLPSPPCLQASKPPILHASELGTAECAERLNKSMNK